MRQIIILTLLISIILLPANFFHPDRYLPDRNDSLLITYIINQVQNNIVDHQPLYYGLFFSPEKNTLTYSDIFLTTSLITLPIRYLSPSPLTVYNVALFLGLILTGLFTYLLIHEVTQDHFSALFGSLLFNFSGLHFTFLPHLQIFSLWLLPLSLYFLIKYLKTKRSYVLILFLLCLTAQIAESFFTAYLIIFTSTIIFLFQIKNFFRQMSSVQRLMPLLLVLPFLPLWYFLAKPYLDLHMHFPEAVRSIHDAAHFSLGLEEILTRYHSMTFLSLLAISFAFISSPQLSRAKSGISFRRQPMSILRKITQSGFHDFASMKSGRVTGRPERRLGNVAVFEKSDMARRWPYNLFLYLTGLSFLMSLGPVLKIFGQTFKIFGYPIPLPYSLFYYLVPGFNGFRTPSRWLLLTALATSILIALFLKQFKTKNLKLILLILLLSILEMSPLATSYSIAYEPPEVYQKVKALPPTASIIELPIKLWSSPDNQIESLRSLYSLYHQHRRFNGYSGFNTLAWQDLVNDILSHGLNAKNIFLLKKLGITHVVSENQLIQL